MDLKVEITGKTIPLVKDIEIKSMSDFIMYMAKVSNPVGQKDLSRKGLIDYLKKNNHWSPFEMCHIVVEIETPRDISRQILRHASARFQEFSQRYAEVQNFTVRELRRQDNTNRQNSIDDFSEVDKLEFKKDCLEAIEYAKKLYTKWLKLGAAKECVRVFLPEGLTMSRLYMAASVRTWIHYLDLREGNGTQKEHVLVANAIRSELKKIEPDLF